MVEMVLDLEYIYLKFSKIFNLILLDKLENGIRLS